MKEFSAVIMMVGLVALFSASLSAQDPVRGTSGKRLFEKHCSSCHPDGGNILNPGKTLSKKDREANGIKTAQDIIRKMRNPGAFDTHPNKWSGMQMFDERNISPEDARKIADYILETF